MELLLTICAFIFIVYSAYTTIVYIIYTIQQKLSILNGGNIYDTKTTTRSGNCGRYY